MSKIAEQIFRNLKNDHDKAGRLGSTKILSGVIEESLPLEFQFPVTYLTFNVLRTRANFAPSHSEGPVSKTRERNI